MIGPGGYAVLALAFGFIVLVGFIGYVLVKLAAVLQETANLVEGVADKTVPLLGEVTTTVVHVNAELERVDAITENVQAVSSNIAGLTALFAATLGGPVVKVAAFSYGIRRATGRRGGKHDTEDRLDQGRKADRAAAKAKRRGRG